MFAFGRLCFAKRLPSFPLARLRVEELETRLTPAGPAIRLDLVALHEFGHSLGLNHTQSGSIMDAYYNANYDINNFANDPVIPAFRNLFADVGSSKWKDSVDPTPGNGRVDITYSFMPDGAKMDKGPNTLFATMNSIFGVSTVRWLLWDMPTTERHSTRRALFSPSKRQRRRLDSPCPAPTTCRLEFSPASFSASTGRP